MATDPQKLQFLQGKRMSEEEYLQLDRNAINARYEYMDGTVRLLAGGSAEHARIARNIANAVEIQFMTGPCTAFTSDVQVLIGVKSNGKHNYVYPDATISCGIADRRRGIKLIQSPRIVIEVLSPSTEAFDKGPKLHAYKSCPTIQEIVLVSQFSRSIELHRRAKEDSDTWMHIFYGPDDSGIDLHCVDIHLTMDEIYQGIDFNEPLIED
jgi:Uma2 family endonuclease